LGRKHRAHLRLNELVDDGAGVVAFEPAVGGDGTFAGAVGTGVHHDHTVARAEQEFRLADDADAVVGHAVEKQHPRAVGLGRSDLPAAEKHAVRGANVKVLALRGSDGEGGIGFADEIGGEFSADGMKEPGRDQPTSDRRQKRREEQQDQDDTDQTLTHKGLHPGLAGKGCLHLKIRIERDPGSSLHRHFLLAEVKSMW
jgi:hypothetical protein